MWQEEQANILATIEKHKDANTNYYAQGIHLLELAQKAYSLYIKQKPTQQRRLLISYYRTAPLSMKSFILPIRNPLT